jgi:hypothetical protein
MHWWDYMVVVAVLLIGISAFVALCVYMGRVLSHGDSHEADTMYDNYADSLRKQRRYARQHGGQRTDEGGTVVAFPEARSEAAVHPARQDRRAA